MTEIDVDCRPTADGWTCHVTLRSPDGSRTTHEVGVSSADRDRLTPDALDPTDLVRRSFEFLLAREPKESILRRFDLPLIGRYFPEYESTIRP
ncbi:MAG TPA: hypothetical protein VFO50_03685 [Candidatus Limnocylindrales bacterium]|nr:hypothetical protein [Candidatus Limnocylindrales bacterium]